MHNGSSIRHHSNTHGGDSSSSSSSSSSLGSALHEFRQNSNSKNNKSKILRHNSPVDKDDDTDNNDDQINTTPDPVTKIDADNGDDNNDDGNDNENNENDDAGGNDDAGNNDDEEEERDEEEEEEEEVEKESSNDDDTIKVEVVEGEEQQQQRQEHKVANLNCEKYGGPSNDNAQEMVYWEDIPRDALHISPFHHKHPDNTHQQQQQQQQNQPITQFLTFESDHGGWNNIRMAMETVLAIAFAMGRTLVLPPNEGMYLIDKENTNTNSTNKKPQQRKFSYNHFFHMESISAEHHGFDIITMKEFLDLCVAGKVVVGNNTTKKHTRIASPPNMRTDWDGAPQNEMKQLRMWLREVSDENLLHWDPDHCLAAFPKSNTAEDTKALEALPSRIMKEEGGFPNYEKYIGKPNPVTASPIERLKEMNADRHKLCVYTPELQNKNWVHFPVGVQAPDGDTSRLLVHFYAFLFFQDWQQDLWMKRFVRDHVRYIDEIQCAAARVVTALRKRVADSRTTIESNNNINDFDTIHIRRGDFQFKETRVDADKIVQQLNRVLNNTNTLYIATDERKKSFFKPIVDQYANVFFLDDFQQELEGVNTNYYGMIDQLIASRGRVFFGCWFSTFTGYINRLRGYHTDDHQLSGYEQGIINSYYYAMPDRFDHMRIFYPIKKQFYAREFPASWRLIDTGTKEDAENDIKELE